MRRWILVLMLSVGCRSGKVSPGAAASTSASTSAIKMSAPRTISTGENEPRAIAIDRTHVYWGANTGGKGALRWAKKSGGDVGSPGPAVPIERPMAIAITSSRVLWIDETKAAPMLSVFSKTNHQSTSYEIGGKNPRAILATETQVFWADATLGTLSTALLDGPFAPRVMAEGLGQPVSIAIDDSLLYLTDGATGRVLSLRREGGAVQTLASGRKRPAGIAVDATDLYWVEWGSGLVMKMPKGGGELRVLAGGQEGPRSIGIDATHVYWTTATTVRRMRKSGSAVETIASERPTPYALAVDETGVYWIEAQGGTVMAADGHRE